MDYRVGEMKKAKKKVKMIAKDLWEGIKEGIKMSLIILVLVLLVFYYFTTLLPLKDYPNLLEFIALFVVPFSVIFNSLFNLYLVEDLKSKRKIRELKSTILLELRYILISLIENFTRFYEVYFADLRFFKFDLKWFYELTEKYREYFPDYLMNDIKICKFVYENLEKSKQSKQEDIEKTIKFLEEYIKEMQLRSLDPTMVYPTMEDVLNNLEKEKSKYRENKLSIKPIHMALLSSILDNLSILDKNFVKDIFYIRYEINKLNNELEVLRELSQTDPKLILSILKRTERIAIKIDEVLEKEGTNL
jgi:hypothetical protein